MVPNHHHNLIQQISELMDSVWRYDTYSGDAASCEACQALWVKLKERHNEDIAMLKKHLAEHTGDPDW
ncbi:MAG: hypothetical protein VE99_C0003G0020 [candidate division Kazan bacterium GW2011_GWC1_52_13]|nr:MAG: hypothetical protein VE99_C0003G0020 [candidate division Kazan bacterium GW2011_GWC1_52_13]